MIGTTRLLDLYPLADAALRGLVLVGLAGLLALVLWRASAALRHLVWAAALASLLVLPVLVAWAPRLEVGVLPAERSEVGPASVSNATSSSSPATISAPATAVAGTGGPMSRLTPAPAGSASAPSAGTGSAPAPAAAAGAGGTAASGWIVRVWALGVLALLLRVGAGLVAVWRLERRCRRLEEPALRHLATRLALRVGLRREFRLLVGPPRTMPMTWGLWRPAVVLPPEALGWPASRLQAVLLHELAHVARRDTLTQLVAELARAAHWFNPLVWLAAHRLRVERELACDDVAVTSGARASDYADELLGLVRTYRASRATPMAAVAMARPGQVSGRLLAVLDETRPRDRLRRSAVAASVLVAALLVPPLGSVTPVRAAAAPGAAALHGSPGAAAGGANEGAPGMADAGEAATVPETVAGVAPAGSAAQERSCLTEAREWDTVQHQTSGDRRTIVLRRRGCAVDVRLDGEVVFDAVGVGIERMGSGARLRIEENDGRTDRWLEARPAGDGRPAFEYRVDGRDRPFDARAGEWFRDALLQLFRTAGFAAEERVDALLAQGGVPAVLRELDALHSGHVYARYATLLLGKRELDQAQARALVRSSTRRVGSDHYMAQVLGAVASHQRLNGALLDDFITASLALDSDHYRTQVLRQAMRSERLTGTQVEALLRAAGDMDSDHYRAEVLREVADRYALEPAFRPAYFAATARMGSDHYRTEVLERLLARSDLSGAEKAAVLQAAGMIGSDHYRTQLLKRTATLGLSDTAVQRAYFEAAAGLGSAHYYREAMAALLEVRPIEPALLVAVLESAARQIDSDHYLSELLLAVLQRHPVEGRVREAFLAAMNRLDSSHYRGRVADALLRLDRQR